MSWNPDTATVGPKVTQAKRAKSNNVSSPSQHGPPGQDTEWQTVVDAVQQPIEATSASLHTQLQPHVRRTWEQGEKMAGERSPPQVGTKTCCLSCKRPNLKTMSSLRSLVCTDCVKQPSLFVDGQAQRFCSIHHKLHPVEQFKLNARNCNEALRRARELYNQKKKARKSSGVAQGTVSDSEDAVAMGSRQQKHHGATRSQRGRDHHPGGSGGPSTHCSGSGSGSEPQRSDIEGQSMISAPSALQLHPVHVQGTANDTFLI